MSSDYLFDNKEDQRELERLRVIESVCDGDTHRRLKATGLARGWCCLEIGPGAGSIMRWLSDVVGDDGSVTAVEINPRFLVDKHAANIEVVKTDIRDADLGTKLFDLIHARFVFIHMGGGDEIVRRLSDHLRPGGWLVLEEPDFSASRAVSGKPEEVESFDRVCKAIDALFRDKSLDPAFGLRLPPLFQESGLSELTVENDAPLSRGGREMARMMRMSTEQLRAEYIATGCADKDDIDRYYRFVEDPASWAIYYATVAASGRKKPPP